MALFGRRQNSKRPRLRKTPFSSIDHGDDHVLTDWLMQNKVVVIIEDGGFNVFYDDNNDAYINVYTDLSMLLDNEAVNEYAELDYDRLIGFFNDEDQIDYILINPDTDAVSFDNRVGLSKGQIEADQIDRMRDRSQTSLAEDDAKKMVQPASTLESPKGEAHPVIKGGNFSWTSGALLNAEVSLTPHAAGVDLEAEEDTEAALTEGELSDQTAAATFEQLPLFGGGKTNTTLGTASPQKTDLSELPIFNQEEESGQWKSDEMDKEAADLGETQIFDREMLAQISDGAVSASDSPVSSPLKESEFSDTQGGTSDQEKQDSKAFSQTSLITDLVEDEVGDRDMNPVLDQSAVPGSDSLRLRFDNGDKGAANRTMSMLLFLLHDSQIKSLSTQDDVIELSFADKNQLDQALDQLASRDDLTLL